MKPLSAGRRIRPVLAVLLFSVAVGFAAVELTRLAAESSYLGVLELEAQRRAYEVTAQTLNGNVMGSAANLGLVNMAMKAVARGDVPPNDKAALTTLEAVGRLYGASGVFVVGRQGVVLSSWDSSGKPSTGLDVHFRPYFRIAMTGGQNVYAAVSLATGQRALYFAAPLYDAVSLTSPVIGAAVARLNLDRVDNVLKAWPGHALLFSPQQIAFSSDQSDWVGRLARPLSDHEMKAIRDLKQFGAVFDSGTPTVLPFDLSQTEVTWQGHRFAVSGAPVTWNDPEGDWSLVLLGDLDEALPAATRLVIAASSTLLTLAIGLLLVVWLGRLQRANASRRQAESDLKVYAARLEADAATKTLLVEVSSELHQAANSAEFSEIVLRHLMPRVPAHYAAVYVFDERTRRLVPCAGHGVAVSTLASYEVGQGLVGECAQRNRPLMLGQVPSLVQVSWGGGDLLFDSVRLVPLSHATKVVGVLVLAFHSKPAEDLKDFLDALLPMVAMNLDLLSRQSRSQTLAWGERFRLGVPQIDREHEALVNLVLSLSEALEARRGRDALDHLLNELITYTANHFASEESLMESYSYPESASHRLEHEELKRTALELQANFRSGQVDVSVETIHFLSNWLSHHILNIDRHLAEFLKGKKI